MMHTEDFDAFMKDVVTHETTPIAHNQHPSLEVFFAQLAGELAPDDRSRFIAHLATCSQCRTRWQSLKRTLDEERRVLESKGQAPRFVQFLRGKQGPATLGKRIQNWLGSLSPRVKLRPVWGIAVSSAVTIAITLAVAIPLLRGPAVATSQRLVSLTNQVHTLQSQVNDLTQGQINITNNALLAEVSPEELAHFSEKTKEITDPWRKALFIAVFLNEHGIRVPKNFDWQHLKTYTVRAGDTWKGLGAAYLGNERYWLFIWLLNAEKLPPDKPLIPGERILLPTLLR